MEKKHLNDRKTSWRGWIKCEGLRNPLTSKVEKLLYDLLLTIIWIQEILDQLYHITIHFENTSKLDFSEGRSQLSMWLPWRFYIIHNLGATSGSAGGQVENQDYELPQCRFRIKSVTGSLASGSHELRSVRPSSICCIECEIRLRQKVVARRRDFVHFFTIAKR